MIIEGKRTWIPGYEERWYHKHWICSECGIEIRTEAWNQKRCFAKGTILRNNEMPKYCPMCGADMRGEQE